MVNPMNDWPDDERMNYVKMAIHTTVSDDPTLQGFDLVNPPA